MGNFTSSVLFGVIIDDSCVLWREEMSTLGREAAVAAAAAAAASSRAVAAGDVDCVLTPPEEGGKGGGDCLVYASARFHFLTHGFAGILDLVGVGFFFLAYFLARNQPWAAKQTNVKDAEDSPTVATTTASSTASSAADKTAVPGETDAASSQTCNGVAAATEKITDGASAKGAESGGAHDVKT